MQRSGRIRTGITTTKMYRLLDHAVQLLELVEIPNNIPGVLAEETIAENTHQCFPEHSDVIRVFS